MNHSENAYLGVVLKNWAAQVRTPAHARSRLLWLAMHTSPAGEPPFVFNHNVKKAGQSLHWCNFIFTWNLDQPIRAGLSSVFNLV